MGDNKGIKMPPKWRRIRFNSLLLGLTVYLSLVVLYFLHPQVLADIEGRLLDARFKLRGEAATTGMVAMVAIDEQSLKELGRWPWSREVLAELIAKVDAMQPGAIGLDIVFSEPQHDGFLQQLDALEGVSESSKSQLRAAYRGRSPDELLAGVIAQSRRVVNGHFFYLDAAQAESELHYSKEQLNRLLASSSVAAVRSPLERFPSWEAQAVRPNIPIIANAGRGAGYFNFSPGHDGLIRYAPLVMRFGGAFYPLLALQTLAVYLDDAPIIVHAEEYGITQISLGDYPIMTDELGMIAINYRGGPKHIQTISALDLLKGRVEQNALAGKMVLIGVTAIGVFDAHSTSFGPQFPGLEIQANVAENILAGDYITRSGIEVMIDVTTMLLLITLLSIVLPYIRSSQNRFFVAIAIILLYSSGNYLLFSEKNLWINLTYPLLAWLLTYLSINVYLAFLVEYRYSHVRAAFKHFIHPDLVDQLTHNQELLHFGGQQKELSVLFSDIRDFTKISENLSPTELAQFMQCYMDPMTEQVLNHNGTLDKYIGDAIMAIYGAPVPTDKHPLDACNTALAMVDALAGIGRECPQLADVFPVEMGIGINTGEMVVGNLGSSFHFTYTCLGDEVNLASRLEGLTKSYGVSVIVSENTYQKVKEHFILRELDEVRVKGKQLPIRIFELCARSMSPSEKVALEQWSKALTEYRAQRWQQASNGFNALLELWPDDKSCLLYLQRCDHFLAHPPAQPWDGVATFTTK